MEKQLNLFAPSTKSILNVYIDGAARGNPGPAGAGVFIPQAHEHPIKEAIYLGIKTNNQAEYMALAFALFLIQKMALTKKTFIQIHSDSQLLVRQMSGIYKVKNEKLFSIKKQLDSLLKEFSHKFIHIPRELNKDADTLANIGIDKKKKIPTAFSHFLANCNSD